MLGQYDGHAKLEVDLANRVQEIRRRNGVELACGFVEDEHTRPHRHDRRQVQQLFLTARQVANVLAKPAFDAEVTRLSPRRRESAIESLSHPRLSRPKRELMPHLIGHNLRIGVLHDEPDLRALVALRDSFEPHPLEEDAACAFTVRRKHAFQVAKERGLAASALSADDDITSLLYLRAIRRRGHDGPPQDRRTSAVR